MPSRVAPLPSPTIDPLSVESAYSPEGTRPFTSAKKRALSPKAPSFFNTASRTDIRRQSAYSTLSTVSEVDHFEVPSSAMQSIALIGWERNSPPRYDSGLKNSDSSRATSDPSWLLSKMDTLAQSGREPISQALRRGKSTSHMSVAPSLPVTAAPSPKTASAYTSFAWSPIENELALVDHIPRRISTEDQALWARPAAAVNMPKRHSVWG